MNLPDHANDLAAILGNISDPSNSLLLLALGATLIGGIAVRGGLSPNVLSEFSLPFSKLTLAAVGFVTLFAWAISGL